jgi:hypothetical protein
LWQSLWTVGLGVPGAKIGAWGNLLKET